MKCPLSSAMLMSRRARPTTAAAVTLVIFLFSGSVPSADLPEGFVRYDGLKEQFTIALPGGWTVYNQAEALGNVMGEEGWSAQLGVVIFSADEIGDVLTPVLAVAIDMGGVPSFFVDRLPKFRSKNLSCTNFTRGAGTQVKNLVRAQLDAIRGQSFGGMMRSQYNLKQPSVKPIHIGGCQGVKVRGAARGGKPDRTRWEIDVRAVTDGTIMYLFTLRNPKENYAKNIETFEKAVATLRLSRVN